MTSREQKSPLSRPQQIAKSLGPLVTATSSSGVQTFTLAELTKQLNCSLPALRKAIDILAKEQDLQIVPEHLKIGTGTTHQVPTPAVWHPDFCSDGPTPWEIRVLSKSTTTLPRHLLSLFDVHGREGHLSSKVLKLYLEKNKPRILETVFVPLHFLPGLVMKDHRRHSIAQMITQDYKKEITMVRETITGRMISMEESVFLECPMGSLILSLEQCLYQQEGPLAMLTYTIPCQNDPVVRIFKHSK